MATQLDDRTFLDAVVLTIMENPGHVYQTHESTGPSAPPSCRYVYAGEADCVIGRALVRAGVPVTELDIIEHDTIQRDDNLLPAYDFLEMFGIGEDVRQWAWNVQQAQDVGKRWGECLARADHPSNGGRPSVQRIRHLAAV